MLTEEQIVAWRADQERERADNAWNAETEIWRAKRGPQTREPLLALLTSYLDGSTSLKQFQITFDKNTRTVWDIMGLKGMSGAMFLNTLAKHVPDQDAADAALKAALPKPRDLGDGRAKMAALVAFVDNLTASGTVAKTHIQAARIPFFLSAWWQLQERDAWPVYYVSMRTVFEQRGVWRPGHGTLVDDYMTFRQSAIDLGKQLGLDVWGVERLCLWLARPSGVAVDVVDGGTTMPLPPPMAAPPAVVAPAVTTPDGTEHTHVQWLLAKLGKQLNLKVWIAQNDQSRIWNGEKLGSYSIPSLPTLGIGQAAQHIVRLIDVIWLKGANQVVAAFEVEYTTSIYSGLLRMSDLSVLAPNSVFPIYIVAPEQKLGRVRDQLKRPTFQSIDLHQRCRFFSIETLIANADAMLAWATDSAAIEKLAERVGDADKDDVPYIDPDVGSSAE